MEEIQNQLIDILCDVSVMVEKEEVNINNGLISDGLLDSFSFVDYITRVEEHFGIEVQDDEITEENVGSVANFSRFVSKKLSN